MASRIRTSLGTQLADAIQQVTGSVPTELQRISWCIRCASAVHKPTEKRVHQFLIPYRLLQSCQVLPADLRWEEQIKWANQVSSLVKCQNGIQKIEVKNNNFVIDYDGYEIKKNILQDVVSSGENYGRDSIIHRYKKAENGIIEQPEKETVLVEYSSPNIAKPFHAGHLRSTIIGNFVANINEALSHKAIRVNYLGDWGTQFGLLGVGYQKYGSNTTVTKDVMEHLFDIYVKINKDISNSQNDEIHQEARAFFRHMEEGDVSAMSLWQYCRDSSVTEYTKMYKRLGIQFDCYEGESMYQKQARDLVEKLANQSLLKYHGTPPVAYVDLSTPDQPNLHANIQKSDGSTLYITRDVAAAIDRHNRLNFDRIHYVVENGQHIHFKQLIGVLKRLGYTWAHRCEDKWHIKFGRVEGMSTRRGEVVFLKDILDEAQACMLDAMKNTNTTQVTANREQVADRLGVSAVIVQDLCEPRLRNYKFNWKRALTFSGETGVALQYTHARLCSLERKCGVHINPESDVTLLTEPITTALIQHLAKYDECLQECFLHLEAHHLTTYLFQLRRLVNLANLELQVKGQPKDLAEARLLLFHSARQTLANGLRVLGITPLLKM